MADKHSPELTMRVFVGVKMEQEKENQNVQIKLEMEDQSEEETPEYQELYEDHIIKKELVIGPEVIQNGDSKSQKSLDEKYVCDYCKIEFTKTRKSYFIRHLNRCPEMPKQPLTCKNCCKVFKTKRNLVQHEKNVCQKINIKIKVHKRRYLEHDRETQKPKINYACEICSEKGDGEITKHIMTKHCTVKDSKHECYYCKKEFKTVHYLLKHIKTHLSNKKIVCPLCNKEFSNEKYKELHLDTYCSKKKEKILKPVIEKKVEEFLCEICNEKSEGDLIKHIIVNHCTVNNSKYKCHYCKKDFKSCNYFQKHIETHLCLNKKIVCPHCSKEFTDEKYRDVHIKCYCTMNKSKIESNAICKLCNRVFSNSIYLNHHIEHACSKIHDKFRKPDPSITPQGKVSTGLSTKSPRRKVATTLSSKSPQGKVSTILSTASPLSGVSDTVLTTNPIANVSNTLSNASPMSIVPNACISTPSILSNAYNPGLSTTSMLSQVLNPVYNTNALGNFFNPALTSTLEKVSAVSSTVPLGNVFSPGLSTTSHLGVVPNAGSSISSHLGVVPNAALSIASPLGVVPNAHLSTISHLAPNPCLSSTSALEESSTMSAIENPTYHIVLPRNSY